MALDLKQVRKEVYQGAYSEFAENLDVEGHDQFATYSEVSEAYDTVLSPLMRTYFDDPNADEVEVYLTEGKTESIDSEAVYFLMEKCVQQALRDAFDPGKSAFDSFPETV